MPIYEYECQACGKKTGEYRHMAFRNTPAYCHACGGPMPRTIERPNINPDLVPYYDENLCAAGSTQGNYVQSRQHKRALLKECGLGEL